MNNIKISLSQLKDYKAYLKEKKNFSDNTINAYLKDVNDLIGYFLKNHKNTDFIFLDYQLLRRYIVFMKQREYSTSTIARKISSFRVFFKYLIQEGLANSNPAEYVQISKIKKHLPEFLFYEEILQLIDSFKENKPVIKRDKAIIELLYGTGMRVAELTNIDLDDVKQDDDTIRIMGKGSKERIVPFSKPVKTAIYEYLQFREQVPRFKYRDSVTDKSLFINCSGKRLTSRSIRRIINKYMLLAGMNKKISPHVLRHTFATHLLNGGADLRSVQELLGHESLSTTQIYTHITKDKLIKTYKSAIPRK